MVNLVSFPGLGITLEVNRVLLQIGDFAIYWYGALIALGMGLAMLFAFSKAKEFGLNPDKMVDVIIVGLVGAVVCARVYYVAFAPQKYTSFMQVINLRDGGIAIYGAILGALIFGVAACVWRKVPVLPMLDIASIGFFIGQAVGRWGNFTNQEAFGTNTTLPWGMYSNATNAYLQSVQTTLAANGVLVEPGLPVHPTFLYESLWCALGFCLLWWFIKRRKYNGQLALMYVAWYGAGRMVIEGLRTDSLQAGSVRVSQLLAAISAFAGVCLLIYLHKKKHTTPLGGQLLAEEKTEG